MILMKVTIADPCGFCSGVRRAINLGLRSAPAQTLGPVVHNNTVIRSLAARGVKPVDDIQSITAKTIVTRAHGTPKDQMDFLYEEHEVIDATCPGVYALHEAAQRFEEEGYHVLVYGDEKHPEITALMSYLSDARVTNEIPKDMPSYVACVSQTTMNPDDFRSFVEGVRESRPNVVYEDTICRATQERQEAAAELASKVDMMVVVGGYHSSNTRKLAALCERYCHTLHVEDACEVNAESLGDAEHIGLTAGASTPDESIEKVYKELENVTSTLSTS